MLNTKTIISLLLVFLVMLLLNTQNIIAQQHYGIKEIGQGFYPKGVNNNGMVVGDKRDGSVFKPFFWHNGNLVFLENNGLASALSTARAINDSNTIVGYLHSGSNPGTLLMTIWDSMGSILFQENPPWNGGYDINQKGVVAGAWTPTDTSYGFASIWINNNLQLLGLPEGSYAACINDSNAVAGAYISFGNNGEEKAFYKKTGQGMIPLPDFSGYYGSLVLDINNNFKMVGRADSSLAYFNAVMWDQSVITKLFSGRGVANSINNHNQIVGRKGNGSVPSSNAFLFENGTLFNLNNLIPDSSGWNLVEAFSISDNGHIAAVGYKNGVLGGVLLYPKPRFPVFIVPGIAGTYAADTEYDLGWLVIRGVTPNALQIDPLGKVYHDLISTFENVGYERDKDLFVVNYDWRLTPGPIDNNFDGHISGISAASITDSKFDYGVDYLGWYIKRASEIWRSNYNEELDSIDVISHSTGGLVTRTYIQSDAYAGIYDIANEYRLPRIRNFIMIGVPNRGASKAWNPINDNWIVDKVYKYLLSKIINRAYQKVLQGTTISGPDGDIDSTSIKDQQGNPDPTKFISQYVPTIRYLLATYNFIDLGNGYTNVNNNPDLRNSIVLDLNDGMDLNATSSPNEFLDSAKVTVIYGSGKSTFSLTQKRTDGQTNAVQAFTDWTWSNVSEGTVWYKDLSTFNNGDGTVPTLSSAAQFLSDNRATLVNFSSGDHTELVSKPEVQSMILNILEVEYSSKDISTGSSADITNVLQVISDPVNLFITDGIGRRLGYSDSTGQVSEIPNSSWYGDSDGVGYVFGSVQQPINLQLIGLGENYYVMVSIEDSTASGGVVLEGFLAPGEVINYQITLDPVSVNQINTLTPENFELSQNYPNPFNPTTTIQYSIPQTSNVSLKVYDILGNEVATLVNEEKERGVYNINFNAAQLASGIYFYKLQAGEFIKTRKMILLK